MNFIAVPQKRREVSYTRDPATCKHEVVDRRVVPGLCPELSPSSAVHSLTKYQGISMRSVRLQLQGC